MENHVKKWKLTYALHTHFSCPVSRHHYSLRCFPALLATQNTETLCCEIKPAADGGSRGTDSFGNTLYLGCIPEPHTDFSVKVEAAVAVTGEVLAEPLPFHRLGLYRYGTMRTMPGSAIRQFGESLREQTRDRMPWACTDVLMQALWQQFRYLRSSTRFETTAEEAFLQGCGVCQDYAHILLALCHMEGLTARYVTGAIPGEGQSHAWIEVWQDGFWKGFDPTNRRETDAGYIRFAHGRDALDCELSRGIFFGNATQWQDVYVIMMEKR